MAWQEGEQSLHFSQDDPWGWWHRQFKANKPQLCNGFMGAVGPFITEQCEVKCEGKLSRNIRDQSTGGLGGVFNDMFSLLNIFGQRLGQQYIEGSVYHCLSVVFHPLNLLLPISEKKKKKDSV